MLLKLQNVGVIITTLSVLCFPVGFLYFSSYVLVSLLLSFSLLTLSSHSSMLVLQLSLLPAVLRAESIFLSAAAAAAACKWLPDGK